VRLEKVIGEEAGSRLHSGYSGSRSILPSASADTRQYYPRSGSVCGPEKRPGPDIAPYMIGRSPFSTERTGPLGSIRRFQ
jgi:hypothetical protein